MTAIGIAQITLYFVVILALVKPVGWYIACVYQGKFTFFSFFENFIHRICFINPSQEMSWKKYCVAFLWLNLLGFLFFYGLERLQFYFPLNPQHFSNVSHTLAFNTAMSFITNSNWQSYSGEKTLSYFTQMCGLTTQNFISAATGITISIALIRALTNYESTNLGNFWVDTIRGILYILLPFALILSCALVSQGVIQNFRANTKIELVQPEIYSNALSNNLNIKNTLQTLPMGPVASQVAIKEIGTNGGGFFNANSSHPFENPTPISNFLEILAILLIPASLCYTFGIMVNDRRQGWTILCSMLLILFPFMIVTNFAEQQSNPLLKNLPVTQIAMSQSTPGGNMEGKETRFGIVNSAIWATATTATSNGSVNSMLDSFTPLGGLIPLCLMQFGEVILGGIGTGLSGMIIFIIMTVFIAGLMVGRTPEYLGKKIEPFEIKMASFILLLMPTIVLTLTAIAAVTIAGTSSIFNQGVHGFTEMLYAFTSMTNNNGSSFAGLNSNTFFYNFFGAVAMMIHRYWIALSTLAIAGALAKKKIIPASSGTLSTDTPLFMVLLSVITFIFGALAFFPVLALGPIAEHLMLMR